MSVVDLLVIATFGVGVTLGVLRGFVPQVTGFFGIGGGLYLASRFHEPVREHLFDPYFQSGFNGEGAFVSLMVASVLLAALIGAGLRRLIASVGLAPYDRVLGGALGAAKAGLLSAAVLMGVVYFAPDGGGLERAIGSSRTGPMFWRAMDEVADELPGEVGGPMDRFLAENALPGGEARTPVREPEPDLSLEDPRVPLDELGAPPRMPAEPAPDVPIPDGLAVRGDE